MVVTRSRTKAAQAEKEERESETGISKAVSQPKKTATFSEISQSAAAKGEFEPNSATIINDTASKPKSTSKAKQAEPPADSVKSRTSTKRKRSAGSRKTSSRKSRKLNHKEVKIKQEVKNEPDSEAEDSKPNIQGRCILVEIPVEVRLIIYNLLLPTKTSMIGVTADECDDGVHFRHDIREDFVDTCSTALLLVNRELHHEFIHFLYTARQFYLGCSANLQKFTKRIGSSNCAMITKLDIGFPFYATYSWDFATQWRQHPRGTISASSNQLWRSAKRALSPLKHLKSLRILVASIWNQQRESGVHHWVQDLVDRQVLDVFNDLENIPQYEVILSVCPNDWELISPDTRKLLSILAMQARTYKIVLWKMHSLEFARLAPVYPQLYMKRATWHEVVGHDKLYPNPDETMVLRA